MTKPKLTKRGAKQVKEQKPPRETLRGHGHNVFLRDKFRCKYCGFDGREFLSWMQLSIDHVLPRSSGGSDEDENLVACCRSCNSITSRMKFERGTKRVDAIRQKRALVRERHGKCLEFWKTNVVQTYLIR